MTRCTLVAHNTPGSLSIVRNQQYTGRSYDQVMRFFTGLELVEPGLVQVQQWRPRVQPAGTLALWAGVGRKP